jgi:hypothetical protein
MDIDALRNKLFEELQNKTKKEIIKELEEAGFIIRYDLDKPMILNSDGSIFWSNVFIN